MGKDTFEAWCVPASMDDIELGNYADHTFVHCTNRNSSFKCWGSADRGAMNAAMVCSTSSRKAYCRANRYRKMPFTPWEDTACVGVYGINGVCHQSANLFLYAAGAALPLNKARPKGILASHALFGMYGADLPGDVASFTTHFAAWNVAYYAQAKALCWLPFAASPDMQGGIHPELVSKVTRLHLERPDISHATGWKSSASLVPQEMQLLLSHYLPGVDNTIVLKAHEEIMGKKDEIFVSYGLVRSAGITTAEKLPTGRDADEMVEKLNGLALEFQSQLARKLGADDYEKINGDRNFYRPIDPLIAGHALDSIAAE